MQTCDELAALPLYQRAVELDPNFAMAYARMGTVYSNLGQANFRNRTRKRRSSFATAPASTRSSTSSRTTIVDSGQLDKGISALELYKQTYPRDSIPYNNLAAIYNQLGQFENALENARKAMQKAIPRREWIFKHGCCLRRLEPA